MSTISKEYQALIERFPLRPIKSDEELDKAHEISMELHKKGESLTDDEGDYLSMLTDAIQRYEDRHHRVNTDGVQPYEILQYLMTQHSLGQSDLKVILGVPQGRASELMNGKRELTKEQLALLAMRFNVSPNVFLPKKMNQETYELPTARDIEPELFEPRGRFVKIDDAINQAIEKAKETGGTYIFDCNGLSMTINKSSKADDLISKYWEFVHESNIKSGKTIEATLSLFE
ncbi:MAG: helix-turn-helix domain-containing protein [Candidatus Obscuribacter sp.]|nr:helix-turn-helix domain-containing protein [Candidatus Obscuribacter sp.]MBK9276967.1 helix-turn-helix domain-containing protein [Candidatus Obscuribacter sp.]